MALPEIVAIWTTDGPAAWPAAPTEMTVTTLSEIEKCPRRWALGAAEYPQLWKGPGYPPRVQLNALAGTVVHLALETITKEFVRAACASVQDPIAFQVMKRLGGYTKIMNDCTDRVLEHAAGNPRAKRCLEFAARSLRGLVPDLRTSVQTMLRRVRLPSSGAIHPAEGHAPRERGPLTVGVFPEIELRARQVGWKGKVDLLALASDRCEITDFKTGAPDDGHIFQMEVYALLWSRDADLNPTRRPANRLVLAYDSGDVDVPAPNAAELDAIEARVVARGEAANKAVSLSPPEARPGASNCRYCGVRQLCAEYWTAKTQRMLAEHGEGRRFTDVEVTTTARHGPSSWDARVELSRDLPTGKSAVVRTSGNIEFHAGNRLRVLDAAIAVEREDLSQPAVITLGALSEVYAVTES